MNLLTQFLLVALGGAVGAMARYAVNLYVQFLGRTEFPWATLGVNSLGSFIAGLLYALMQDRWPAAPGLRVFAAVGFLGAFTTFSAFSVETVTLLSHGAIAKGVLNAVFNLALCLLLAGGGMVVARLW